MEHLVTHLKELGLTEKQARVYIALVELGRGTAYAIAKQADVKRPITYVILDELRLKGLALKVPHSKKQMFIAREPSELFALQEERLAYAKRALPELLALSREHKKGTRMFLFETASDLSRAIAYKESDLASKELLAFYAKSDGRKIPAVYLEHNERLAKQKTKVRSFVPKHHSLKAFEKFDKLPERTTVHLPEEVFNARASIEITDSFVRIFLHRDRKVLIIENKDLTDTLRQIFEMVWKTKRPS
jgi:HTH-type transcriptional regulator, sugar sensing transcriptional regulator